MGTILIPTDTFDAVVSPNPFEPVRASGAVGVFYVIAGLDANGGVVYTPNAAGVRVRHLGGMGMTLGVTVSGNDITVQLATTVAGAITSNANAVVAAVNVAASALVTASAQGTGLGLAGVNVNFMPLTDDPFGSVRPPFQSLTNQATWLRNGVVLGTRTVRKLHADGTGAVASLGANGEVLANNAIQVALNASQGARLEPSRVIWRNVGTGAGDGNPPSSSGLTNELRPVNICKAWGIATTNGAGAITLVDGINVSAVSILVTDRIEVTLSSGLLSANCSPVVNVITSGFLPYIAAGTIFSTTAFRIDAIRHDGSSPNFSTSQYTITFHVFARQ